MMKPRVITRYVGLGVGFAVGLGVGLGDGLGSRLADGPAVQILKKNSFTKLLDSPHLLPAVGRVDSTAGFTL